MYHQQHDQEDQIQYEYRFQYSLASYCLANSSQEGQINNTNQEDSNTDPAQQQTQSIREDEQRILRRSSELIMFKCFLNHQTQNLIKTIFTHYINLYTPLAMRLLKIAQLIFPNLNLTTSTFITQCQTHLDCHRQKLVDSIKNITKIFHNEKQTFMKYLALSISSAVFKILTLQNGQTEVDFQSVFHTITWELTGTHSTSQSLKKLLSETFNPVNFHRYLMNEEPPKIRSFLKSFAAGRNQMGKSVLNFNRSNTSVAGINSSLRSIQLFQSDKKEKLQQKAQMSFSKRLLKKDHQINNKENLSTLVNYPKKNIFEHKRQQLSNTQFGQIAQQHEQVSSKSNNKDFNFKKDRTTFFQNFSKTKTTKKPFADYLSSTKKTTFASYLEQRQLQFDS